MYFRSVWFKGFHGILVCIGFPVRFMFSGNLVHNVGLVDDSNYVLLTCLVYEYVTFCVHLSILF